MSKPQMIPANMWTHVLGTELEVLVKMDGVTRIEVEHVELQEGGRLVPHLVVNGFMDSRSAISVRGSGSGVAISWAE